MEYVTPAEEFETFPGWHTLAPSGPAYENWTDDDGDPVRVYTVDLLYLPYNFWFMIRFDYGAIEIGDKFHCWFSRDTDLQEIYIDLDIEVDDVVEKAIKFTFPFVYPPFQTHRMCAAGVVGDYSLRNYNKLVPWYEEMEREGAEQTTFYWFLHMSGSFGYPKPPIVLPNILPDCVFRPIGQDSLI